MTTLRHIWEALLAWFCIRRLDRLVDERNTSVFRLLRWYARIFLAVYLLVPPALLIGSLPGGDQEGVMGAGVTLVLFPVAVKVVMAPLVGFWDWWTRPGRPA